MSPHWPFETSRGARWVLLLLGLLWIALGAGDWVMRFRWFRWQQRFVFRPSSPFHAPFRPLQVTTNAPFSGGDLSRLIGIPSAERRFTESRPASRWVTDEFGFFNQPPVSNRTFHLALVGDSYMLSGPDMEDAFSSRLEDVSGKSIYNFAYAGRGSFWSILRFLLSDRFEGQMPAVIVWGLVEREIAGGYFAGVRAQLQFFDRIMHQDPDQVRFNRHELTAARLRTSLPNSSLVAQFSGRLWNRLRYYAFGKLADQVIPVEAGDTGDPFLMYRLSVDAMRWDDTVRNLPQVVEIITLIRDMAHARGSELAIVLIPEKERVYEDLIPEGVRQQGHEIRPSILPALTEMLLAEGIPAVNLLPAFREARASGGKLYWNDDTHWHPGRDSNCRGGDVARLAGIVGGKTRDQRLKDDRTTGQQDNRTTGRQDNIFTLTLSLAEASV